MREFYRETRLAESEWSSHRLTVEKFSNLSRSEISAMINNPDAFDTLWNEKGSHFYNNTIESAAILLFYNRNIHQIKCALDAMCKFAKSKKLFDIEIPIGSLIDTIQEIRRVHLLMKRHRKGSITQQRIQLLSSLCRINSTCTEILNLDLIKYVSGLLRFRKHHQTEILKCKGNFNAQVVKYFDGEKKIHTENMGFPSLVHDYAEHHWHISCAPSPNPKHTTALFTGSRHIRKYIVNRIQFNTAKFLYAEFCKRLRAKFPHWLKRGIDGELIVPSYVWYTRKRMPWIKAIQKDDYAYCMTHGNSRWIRQDILRLIQNPNLHSCRTTLCPDYRLPMGSECTCENCAACPLREIFEMNDGAFFRELCCSSNSEICIAEAKCWRPIYAPKSSRPRIHGNIKCECAMEKIRKLLDGKGECGGINAPGDHQMNLRRYRKQEFSEKGNGQWIECLETVSWDTIRETMYENLYKWMQHHFEFTWGFQQQRDFLNIRECNIPKDSACIVTDMSNNIKIEGRHKGTRQWADRLYCALCPQVIRWSMTPEEQQSQSDSGKRIRVCDDAKGRISEFAAGHGYCPTDEEKKDGANWRAETQNRKSKDFFFYRNARKFCKSKEWILYLVHKDPKHDWSWTVNAFEQTIRALHKKRKWKRPHLRAAAKKIFVYSDGSGGEYKNSGFVACMKLLCNLWNLEIFWSFTTTSHGKGWSDGAGHVLKSALVRNVYNGVTVYALDKEFADTIADDMNAVFKSYKDDRQVKNLSDHNCSHIKAKGLVKTRYNGIRAFNAYWITKDLVRRKHLDCKCNDCLYGDPYKCKFIKYTGSWTNPWIPEIIPKNSMADYTRPWVSNECMYNYTLEKTTTLWVKNAKDNLRREIDEKKLPDMDPEKATEALDKLRRVRTTVQIAAVLAKAAKRKARVMSGNVNIIPTDSECDSDRLPYTYPFPEAVDAAVYLGEDRVRRLLKPVEGRAVDVLLQQFDSDSENHNHNGNNNDNN